MVLISSLQIKKTINQSPWLYQLHFYFKNNKQPADLNVSKSQHIEEHIENSVRSSVQKSLVSSRYFASHQLRLELETRFRA